MRFDPVVEIVANAFQRQPAHPTAAYACGFACIWKALQQFASLIDVLFERFRRLIAILQPLSLCGANLPLCAR